MNGQPAAYDPVAEALAVYRARARGLNSEGRRIGNRPGEPPPREEPPCLDPPTPREPLTPTDPPPVWEVPRVAFRACRTLLEILQPWPRRTATLSFFTAFKGLRELHTTGEMHFGSASRFHTFVARRGGPTRGLALGRAKAGYSPPERSPSESGPKTESLPA